MNVLMSTFSQRFDADHRILSTTRSDYRAWFESAGRVTPGSTIDPIDVDVVATELAANVIDHTDSPWVWLEITAAPTEVTVTVSHLGPASAIPDVAQWGALDEGARGRGLRMVRALCDQIEVGSEGDTTSIRCRLLS
jgi:anti-sigma regulatory factor (Ser/Thr protein kinase)